MKVVEYIKKQQSLTNGTVIPLLRCKDGFTVSCQASDFHYCSPRALNANWYQIELGFPSGLPTYEICKYAEDKEDLLGTVYAYVPVELVDAMLDEHNGIADQV